QQRVDLHAGDRAFAHGHRHEWLYAVALSRRAVAGVVRHDLRLPLRAVHLLGAAAVLRDPGVGRVRLVPGAAAAAHRGAHLLLFLADEGLLRRDRPVDGARGAAGPLHAL